MTTITTDNFNNQNDFVIPGFQIMCLTPEEDDYPYEDEEETMCNWIDDSECQENLSTILPLIPESCIVDSENHILNTTGVQLFFEEIGILYDEPEPIDPHRNYEAEAKILIEERNKTRKMHIDLSPMPSLDDTTSGISSASSSFHEPALVDMRSPHYMGHQCGGTQIKMTAYAYAPHVFSPIRSSIL